MINKYSFGIGDRFAQQGKYLLQAFVEAKALGLDVTPVWNKSYREHKTVHSLPQSVKNKAEEAVETIGWKEEYFVDADHINADIIDQFIPSSNFFTIDVADQIGCPLSLSEKSAFLKKYQQYIGLLSVPGMSLELIITTDQLLGVADKFYKATKAACYVFQRIQEQKIDEDFIIEISMDEVDYPQSPVELFFILKMLADQNVPVNAIAPKFSGKFNIGVDYEGDIEVFKRIFEDNLMVLKYAVKAFGLPSNLKLSIHTGSDKFSLYPAMNELIKKHDAGLHIKTAGTTWLEELIGIAQSGTYELAFVRNIALEALDRYDELIAPYAKVVSINKNALPSAWELKAWNATDYISALKHNQNNPSYNPHLRQLLHTAYKLAAESRDIFIPALKKHANLIGENVKENILERHIKPLFL